jgi:hypothetical protein
MHGDSRFWRNSFDGIAIVNDPDSNVDGPLLDDSVEKQLFRRGEKIVCHEFDFALFPND